MALALPNRQLSLVIKAASPLPAPARATFLCAMSCLTKPTNAELAFAIDGELKAALAFDRPTRWKQAATDEGQHVENQTPTRC